MYCKKLLAALLASAVALAPIQGSHAQGIPVIDVAAIARLIEQIGYLTQQIRLMQMQLSQLQQANAAITGPRGMESLLAGMPRNYLPQDWSEMVAVINNTSTTYSGLASQVQTAMSANAVVSRAQLSTMTPDQLQIVEAG